jgi:ABC-2 type transport system permease protein
MLWYKFWLESRLRFLLSLAGLVLFAAFFVLITDRYGVLPKPAKEYHMQLFIAHQYLVGLWMLSIVLLGMGGLLRERATGISQFTLALPAERIQLVWVRFGAYLTESIALALAPWITLVLITHFTGQQWSFREALFFDSLLIGGGLAFVGLTTLVSSLVEGEYTAPVVAFGIILVMQVASNSVSWLKPLDFWRLQGGFNCIDPSTWLMVRPFPWAEILLSLLFLLLAMVASIKAIERREF